MKFLIIVIVMDIFIFSLGIIFADKELKTVDTQQTHFHVDRYGYYWNVSE